jgi:hypothetical protein
MRLSLRCQETDASFPARDNRNLARRNITSVTASNVEC